MLSHEDEFSVQAMCRTLDVARSGYYAWKRSSESKRAAQTRRLDADITRLSEAHRGRYGSPRITREWHAEGWAVSRRRVAKRMQWLGLRARAARKYKATTQSKHTLPVAPNLLEQGFTATAPNQKWVSDLTYIWTEEGWLYLAGVLDLYSRTVVSWSMSERMTREVVIAALTMAVLRRRPGRGLIIHSDRGSQYTSHDYPRLLEN